MFTSTDKVFISGKKNLLNHQKDSKHYEHDRLQNFLLLFMSLLKALIAKNSRIFLNKTS